LLTHDRPHRNVMLIGGIRTPSDALVGPLAVQALATLHLDQVFLGVHGMTERAGYTTPNLLEADTNRAFVEASQRLIVVADHSKWNTVGLASIAALEAADVVVTDDGLEPAAIERLRVHVDDVVVCSK
jgi:DeoR/GlpR family transcriptional regulator of sugar metabolism